MVKQLELFEHPVGERVVEQALRGLEPGANKEQLEGIALQQLGGGLFYIIDDMDHEYSDSDIDEFVDNVTAAYRLKNSRRHRTSYYISEEEIC
jgi:hypothetical protein